MDTFVERRDKRDELIDKRRDIIRRQFYLGNKLPAIISSLEKNSLFPRSLSWGEKCRIVEDDLRIIHKEDRERLATTLDDQKEAQQQYILRQMHLWDLAMEAKDLATASQVSKDIARAQGVQTDQPIQVKTDLAELLMGMSRKKSVAQDEKPKIEERKAVSLLPEQFRIVKTIGTDAPPKEG